ncbi:hypothetical protein [Mongoliitalea lutea]|uniref:Uncharacterized protein n=1 Tax=Mongoliitalea lutea TaxID=849756 RepID=A0A8J3D0R7_9BACT|nr:hypothetical protein [Mongoliitalea lutea]GHB43410.1 hypothetical protein GCM10008106_25480 [Mongoliitalea lutea]
MENIKETVPFLIFLAAILSVDIDEPNLECEERNGNLNKNGTLKSGKSSIQCVNRIDADGNFYKSLQLRNFVTHKHSVGLLSMLTSKHFKEGNISLILNQLNNKN